MADEAELCLSGFPSPFLCCVCVIQYLRLEQGLHFSSCLNLFKGL